ncbi:SEL1-like repeat protein [Limnoglobus roseus]|uniref:Cobalamin biosynthesis protein CobT n=1 Tax=Limnoglobus roseus TaxID=2598579 RepID=A0A5C1AUI4_9BACT|nr:SEL1-like repeat protein [Limnoglobus roseus]QEL20904.1 cobalamin biosynthesis protein CobT [Limnoglobus roseus]
MTDDIEGFTVTLFHPNGTLSKAVVGLRISEPTPDVDPDATLVPFLQATARRLSPAWGDGGERFDVADETKRETHSVDTRCGGYKVGTADRHLAVRFRYDESEQEMFPVPRYESRWYSVAGLPDGWRVAASVYRVWNAGTLETARVQVRCVLPAEHEAAVIADFRAACEDDTRRPRVLGLVPARPLEALQQVWELAVRTRHGGADLAAVLTPFAYSGIASWEQDAAGDPRAAVLAGDCHLLGLGWQAKDRDRAEAFYRQAVAAGDLTAMTNLAELLDARNPAEATDLLRTAAEAGEARAQGLYGKRCFTGTGGVAKDADAARTWFEQGADGDDARSQNNLASLVQKSEPSKAERLLRRAAERGEPVAMLNVGKICWEPAARNQAPDHDEAMIWFRRSARRGHVPAQTRLGQEYVRGVGCTKDPAAGRHWFLQAARGGDPMAQLNVGVMFEKADGGPAAFEDAELWFRTAAAAGNETAKQYHADLLKWRADDLARREEAGELPYARVPSPYTLNALLYTQNLDPNDRSGGLPQYGWRGGWKMFSFLMPAPDTVVFGVSEDEDQTEGRAGFPPQSATLPLAEFLADGPPAGLIDQSDLSVLVPVLEHVLANLAQPEPVWLQTLRLHAAVCSCSVDVIRDRATWTTSLARAGGRDALYWAVRSNRADAVGLLLADLGGDANAKYDDGTTLTPLMGAVIVAARDEPELPVFDALLRGGADVNARNSRGETALAWMLDLASTDGIWRPTAFDWLLANKADPNAADQDGRTPLALVMGSKFLPEVKHDLATKLFAAGATVPPALRDAFHTAAKTWHAAGWRLGFTLIARSDRDKWADDTTLFFRDAVAGVETAVGTVTTLPRTNVPYAADESFSYDAELRAAGATLFVRVVQRRETVGPPEESVGWYTSTDAGHTWAWTWGRPPETPTVELCHVSG